MARESIPQAVEIVVQTMADFLVAHLGHGDTPAECTPEAESLRTSAARSAHYASAFTHSLGERIFCLSYLHSVGDQQRCQRGFYWWIEKLSL